MAVKQRSKNARTRGGEGAYALPIKRYFSQKGKSPYDLIEWEKTDTQITDDTGSAVFVQKDVEFPKNFTPLAVKVVASKYFYGDPETTERESSYRQLADRVCTTIAGYGVKDGYFSREEGEIFRDELTTLFLGQMGAFNSPVEFNVGTMRYPSKRARKGSEGYIYKEGKAVKNTPEERGEEGYPQTSACFIQGLTDDLEDIMRLATSESMLFKHGSGTGTDLSTLRSSREKLSGGGKPSGPLGYEKHYDVVAGVIKSGGKTRRAAKMNSLKVDHPDILEFIEAKPTEERKVHSLMRDGWSSAQARETVAYQNANFSIRITDDFMGAVEKDGDWQTIPVHSKELASKMPKYKARVLFRKIAEAAHFCGDPGVQYHDIINRWHTCPNSGPINASNPCSEYMFVDDSSCNLASLNLLKFKKEDGTFDLEKFGKAIEIFAVAQDLLYDNSSFPEPKIAENSHKFRPIWCPCLYAASISSTVAFSSIFIVFEIAPEIKG